MGVLCLDNAFYAQSATHCCGFDRIGKNHNSLGPDSGIRNRIASIRIEISRQEDLCDSLGNERALGLGRGTFIVIPSQPSTESKF
jgi:hypothetical protein